MRISVKRKHAAIIAGLFIVIGLIGSLPAVYFHVSNAGSVSSHGMPKASAQSLDKDQPLISGQPIAISVPSVKINIPVIKGYYNQTTRDWTLTLDKAQFATPTALPNNHSGNTFIYGHARVGVFSTLPDIQKGGLAYITTDNGYKFKYAFYSTYATQPTDVSVLNYQGPPMLTMQTCSGSWYQNRQMFLFSYQGYEKTSP
jgi:LPXTG-site transpeptidase (sortase) family protein